jgi:hypothetical protein
MASSFRFLLIVLGSLLGCQAAVTPLPEWKMQNFSAVQLRDGSSDDAADPNGDGVPNLVAYALGLGPLVDARRHLPWMEMAALKARFVHRRVTAAVDVISSVEWTSGLSVWTTEGTQVSSITLGAGVELVAVEDSGNLVALGGRRFARLTVLRTVFDVNADGLPDDWQLRHFSEYSGGGLGAPGADPEPDGFTNAEEFLVGTDPRAAASPAGEALIGLTLWTTLR